MSDVTKKEYDSDGIRKEVEKPCGTRSEIVNRRGNLVMPRKYHISDKQVEILSDRFIETTKDVSQEIRDLAGSDFFNPYRQAGIYYGCVQSLYILGCNDYHQYLNIFKEMSKIMSAIVGKDGRTSWQKFCSKGPRMSNGQIVVTAKDVKGRIKQNFRVIQRLGGLHPYGMKLAQVSACIDIKRCKDGKWEYQLRTMIIGAIVPIFDTLEYPEFKKVDSKVVDTVESNIKV